MKNIKIDEFPECSCLLSFYRCFFAKSCLCGIIIVMTSVRRFWCNRILYCPQSILGKKHLSWRLIFLFYFGLGRRGTVHEEAACRIRGKPVQLRNEGFRQRPVDFFLISVTVRLFFPTRWRRLFLVSLLVDDQAQESGSRTT